VVYEDSFLFAEDKMRHYQVGMYPYRASPAGPVTHAVVVTFDITARKEVEEKLAQRVKYLNALHTVEQAVISSTDLKTVLEILVREVIDRLRVDAASVLLFNSQTQTLEFAARQGFRTDALKFTRLKLGVGLAGQAALEREIVHIINLTEMNEHPGLVQTIVEENFVTYFGIPLIAKDRLLGILEIFQRSELVPDPGWMEFLETLSGQAAIAIDNARLLEETRQNLKETNALYHINQQLIGSSDAEDLMNDVVNLLQKGFGYYYVQIFVTDPKTGNFVVRAGSGEIGERLKSQGYHLIPGEGIVGLTAETGKPFFTNNVDEVISFVRTPLLSDTKSELAVPIVVGHRFLGLLDIHQESSAHFTERDVQLMCAVADQLAVALQKAELYADLQEALYQEQTVRSQLIHTEKLTVAGRLLASVSHELNNPIQAIQNALFLLKSEKDISAQGKQDLEIVLSETERMASMLQRLRTTYQPGNFDDFKPVQINDVIEDVCALVATHLRHSQISFEFYADPDLPTILGVDGQIRQVILNLFMNAVDAMAEGGHLTIATKFLAISQEVLLTVADTGPGIEPSILPNIFEAFVTNKDRGTGLGLAISYEIILKHRGRINAENNPKRGATFSVWLPADGRGNE
jgi:signal transduction histidine kinase